MGWFEYALVVGIIALVILPPKYDPAIRWKERNEAKRQKHGSKT